MEHSTEHNIDGFKVTVIDAADGKCIVITNEGRNQIRATYNVDGSLAGIGTGGTVADHEQLDPIHTPSREAVAAMEKAVAAHRASG